MENKRISLGTIDSKAHINGFLLSPHLGLSVPMNIKGDTIILSPFTQLDFVSNWQGKVRETGASGFNVRIGSHYTLMLRTELGLKFLEVLKYSWGNIILVQKGSYVNKKPFSTHPQHAYFAGGTSSFDVKLFPGELQNLGVVSLGSQFVPCSNKHFYGSINYQGEFGSKFQSHSLVFEIGKRF